MTNSSPLRIQRNLLQWFAQFGRKDLPWQQPKTPYRVWVSEIMLQQTQVNTVIPYFNRFINTFPTLDSLAAASLESVLHHWTGLGYYARARNLHRAAQIIQADYQGQLPTHLATWLKLPGVGRSTAGAILSLSGGQSHPILDGNVKRILSRVYAISGWSGETAVMQQLWQLATALTPTEYCAEFNQALMDLGSSLCSRSKPACQHCPLQQECQALQTGTVHQYPARKPKKALPERTAYFLMLLDTEANVLLEQRPGKGLWGGLWTFPQCATQDDIETWVSAYRVEVIGHVNSWPNFRHTFTHFHLTIQPMQFSVRRSTGLATPPYQWYSFAQTKQLGLPAPVVNLLQQLSEQVSHIT